MRGENQSIFHPAISSQALILFHEPLFLDQQFRDERREVDRSPAFVRFWRTEKEPGDILALLAAALGDDLVDREAHPCDIQVFPSQPVHFLGTQARGDCKHVERFMAVASRGFEKFPGLIRTQKPDFHAAWLHSPVAFGRPEPRRRRIAVENLPFDRKLERPPKNGLSVFNGSIAQTPIAQRHFNH